MLVTSSRVAVEQSPITEAGPKLMRLIEVVMESMYVVPIMVSCHSCVAILVVVAAPTRRLGVNVFSQGRLVMIQGMWFSLKDCAISAKPGGHVGYFSTHLSGGADTCSKILACQGSGGAGSHYHCG